MTADKNFGGKAHTRRSGIRIMGQLIGLVKPLLPVMLLAIALGTIGYLCAIFLTILAGFGLMHIILEPMQEFLGYALTPEQAGIFRRFYRGKAVREQEGLGIGLYLTREILRRQGGYVKVASKVGAGSTFSLYLHSA